MIPDEDIEAAALGIHTSGGVIVPQAREYARAALEAAAPHMLARVWDEGRKHGATYPYGERGLATDDNSYRSQA